MLYQPSPLAVWRITRMLRPMQTHFASMAHHVILAYVMHYGSTVHHFWH